MPELDIISQTYKDFKKRFPIEALQKDDDFDGAIGIKPQYIKERLNEVLGIDGWEFQALPERHDQITPCVKENNGSIIVYGVLTINVEGNIVKSYSYGGSKLDRDNPGNSYKSAETNALKKAASRFGIGWYTYCADFNDKEKSYMIEKGWIQADGTPPKKKRSTKPDENQIIAEILKVKKLAKLSDNEVQKLWDSLISVSEQDATIEQKEDFLKVLKQYVNGRTPTTNS